MSFWPGRRHLTLSAIDIPAIADPQHAHHDARVLDIANDAPVPHAAF